MGVTGIIIHVHTKEEIMGYAYYTVYRNGQKIEAGYGVEADCEEANCGERIDRGLAYLCGNEPGGDEYGCGGYYCGKHLYGAPEGETGGRCKRCTPETDDNDIRLDRRGLCPAGGHLAPLDANGVVLQHHASRGKPCEEEGEVAEPVSADAEMSTAATG